MKRMDWVIVALILTISLGCLGLFLLPGGAGSMAEIITPQGTQRVSLKEDRSFTVETELGYNRVEVKDGTVRVIEADCKDKVCIHQGTIDRAGQTIVCLPHQMVIRIEKPDRDVDTVAE